MDAKVEQTRLGVRRAAHSIPRADEARLPAWLKRLTYTALVLMAAGLLIGPRATLWGLFFLISLLMFVKAGLRLAAIFYRPPASLAGLKDADLPVITIMLPLYHEANMVGQLCRNIGQLNYPVAKMDVLIICEPEDQETINAAAKCAVPPFRLFVTTGDPPRTKPNALNQALQIARGQIITVYDAEDRPHPEQLRHAAKALKDEPDLGVVQAPLTFYNARENWLTRQFAMEYDGLFRVWLPLLARLGFPFPLGGTSNHIRREALIDVGGWDGFNVTEDADLSFRLAAKGWTLGVISPPTFEEAVTGWRAWKDQRSRWMKGYMQSWIAHMNRPLAPDGWSGAKRQFTVQLTLGMTLVAGLFHLPIVCLTALFIWIGQPEDGMKIILIFAPTGLTYLAGLGVCAAGARRSGRAGLCLSLPITLIYWLLLFFPALKALVELQHSPYLWNKTAHGRSRIDFDPGLMKH